MLLELMIPAETLFRWTIGFWYVVMFSQTATERQTDAYLCVSMLLCACINVCVRMCMHVCLPCIYMCAWCMCVCVCGCDIYTCMCDVCVCLWVCACACARVCVHVPMPMCCVYICVSVFCRKSGRWCCCTSMVSLALCKRR